MKTKLYVHTGQKRYQMEAESLAKHLQVPLIGEFPEADKEDLVLSFGKEGLSLNSGKLSLIADLTTMLPRVKDEMWKHELIAKASKFKNVEGNLTAIDATAGLGEDSLILAAAGFSVILYEYDPVIAALLKDALRRAKKVPELKEMVQRMTLVEGDSIRGMTQRVDEVDLIYLDPMFPERQKSCLIKKKFQLLQKLESPCSDEEELLQAALVAKPKRIMIKRPAKGPYIAGVKPAYSILGKSIRYDCITP